MPCQPVESGAAEPERKRLQTGTFGVAQPSAAALGPRRQQAVQLAEPLVQPTYGFQGYAVWPYNAAPPPFKGRRLGWSSFVKEKALLNEIIAAGKSGLGPRAYFGGYVANKPEDQQVYAALVKEFPDIDILGVTTQVYAFHGPDFGGNACPAVRLALDATDFIPARDLLLIRAGRA